MQVPVRTAGSKNVQRSEDSLCRPEDVGEREAALVGVPRPNRRSGQGAAVGALGKPDDEDRERQADERRRSFDGFLLAGRGVGEAEQLLEVLEHDLDGQD